ncbi:MAG: hypothetical protein V8R80_02370 [Eubacterium sp.]
MMLIFFTILKIIGIVFLIAACLIGIVLFVPVFYELDADIDEDKYTFRLSWLFSLIRFCFTYQEKMTAVLSVLFFRADFADPKRRAAREEKKKKRQEKKRKKAQKKKNRKRDRQREKYLKEREKNRSSIDLGESLNEAVQGKKDEAIPGESRACCCGGRGICRKTGDSGAKKSCKNHSYDTCAIRQWHFWSNSSKASAFSDPDTPEKTKRRAAFWIP